MEQTPLNFNSQNEDKSAINIPPVSPDSPIPPNVYPAEPVSPVMDDNPLRSSIDMNAKQTGQQFKLASTEVQGPKPPLVSGDNSKLVLIATALILIIIAGIGGYYFYAKNNSSGISEVILPPTPTEAPLETPAETSMVDKNLDTDSDGLPDYIEKVIGADLNKADTDGDGFSDLQEIKNGYSPLTAGATGKYMLEDRQAVKDKIAAADAEFYNKEFGIPAVPFSSPSPIPEASLTPSSTPTPGSL